MLASPYSTHLGEEEFVADLVKMTSFAVLQGYASWDPARWAVTTTSKEKVRSNIDTFLSIGLANTANSLHSRSVGSPLLSDQNTSIDLT